MEYKPEYKKVKVISNEPVGRDVFMLALDFRDDIKPGMFYMMRFADGSPLLGRPLSVCRADAYMEFCYVVVGPGTRKLSELTAGGGVYALGPLGNGFDIPGSAGRIAIVSGGIGIAPFVELAARLSRDRAKIIDGYFGFASEPYLLDRFDNMGIQKYVSTDDGCAGHKGFITEILDAGRYDLVTACGPEPFLKAVARMCAAGGTPSLLSLDRHMACGVGACLVCVCMTVSGNKRVCKDGPVFSGSELIL